MRKLLLLALVTLAALLFTLLPPGILSLATLQHSQARLMFWHAQHPVLAVSAFFLCYFLITALSIPAATLITLMGGALFGLLEGTLLVATAATCGATLAMLLSRYLLRDRVQTRFSRVMIKVNQGMAREGAYYLFALRLTPVFPFVLVNLLMGLTSVSVVRYAIVTLAGILPATVVYTNTGRQLSQVTSLHDILSPGMMLAFALSGLLPLASRWLIKRTTNASPS